MPRYLEVFLSDYIGWLKLFKLNGLLCPSLFIVMLDGEETQFDN